MNRMEIVFTTLMSGLIAGPAVSFVASPTVSPTTAALWASECLPPKWPLSMYFFALSQAPPPVVIMMRERESGEDDAEQQARERHRAEQESDRERGHDPDERPAPRAGGEP